MRTRFVDLLFEEMLKESNKQHRQHCSIFFLTTIHYHVDDELRSHRLSSMTYNRQPCHCNLYEHKRFLFVLSEDHHQQNDRHRHRHRHLRSKIRLENGSNEN